MTEAPPASADCTPHRLRWWIAAAFAGAFLLIVGARWMVVGRFGNDLPFHDQWNAEAVDVLRPHWSGGSIWPGLWRANNEHRTVWTRLLAVGLADLDGQWNARTQLALNAVLAALAALTVPALFRRSLPRSALALVLVVATIGAALPLAWETAQWGFLSAFQLLVLFGLAHLALTWAADRCDWRWGLGTLAGIAALGTMGSGFASALASVALASWRLVRERDASASVQRFLLLTLGVNLALALVGFALVAPAPQHAAMRAHSLFTFLRGFGRVFAWPETNPLFGIAFVLPFVAVLAAGSRRRRLEKRDAMFGAVLAWYGAQAIALALARGGEPWPFPPRYYDLLALGLVLGLVCLLRLFAALRGPRAMLAGGLVLAGWLVVVGHGWHARFTEVRVNQLLEQRAALQVAQVKAVRAYLMSGNRTTLADEPATRFLHQDTNQLADLLDNAGIRAHLPPAVRFPLRFEPEATESRNYAAFVVPPEAEQIYRAAAWCVTPTATEAARFVSEPIPAAALPLLRLRVHGEVRPGAASLQTVDATGRIRLPLERAIVSPDRWKTVTLERGTGPTRIVIEIAAGAAPLEITAPTDMGRLTWLTEKALRHGRGLRLMGAILLGIALVAGLIVARPQVTAPRPQS